MRKRILMLLLVFVMCLSNVVTVFATGETSTTEKTETTSSDFAEKLGVFLDKTPTEDDVYNWSSAISALKTDGFSNEAIAGILGNVKMEGGTNCFCIEGYMTKETTDGKKYTEFQVGNIYDYGDVQPSLYTSKKSGKTMGGEGHGLVQWSFGRATNLTKFAEENEYAYVTVTHWHKSYDSSMEQHTCKIPNMAGQVCFMIQELNTDYKDVKEAIKDLTSASDAARIFHDEYEKSGTENVSERQTAANDALSLVEACTSVEGSGTNEQKMVDILVHYGIWGEAEFLNLSQLVETPLEFPTQDQLSKEQLQGVISWKNNIEWENDTVFTKYLRVLTMFMGILFLVWIVLIYLSYWFDRINNFIEIEFLPIVTFSRLRVSPEEDECTFHVKGFFGGQALTVNHKTTICICLIGLFVAIFVISGKLNTMLNILVRWMLHKLNIA